PYVDSGITERGSNYSGYFLVLGGENTRPCVEQLNSRAESIENRRDLRTSSATANHYHRWWDRNQAPRIAVCRAKFGTGNNESTTYSSGTNDEFVCLQRKPTLGLQCGGISETR